jgi:predicted kinase
LTGDVSDQSKNAEVFRLAFERLAQHVEAGDDVVFDSTGTRKKTRLQIISTAKKANPDCKLHLAVLMDSMNPDLCRARVAKDIEEGVDRSNTLNPMDAIIERQSDAFAAAIKEIASENWDNIQLLVPTEPA